MVKSKAHLEIDSDLKLAAEKILLRQGVSAEAAIERIFRDIVETNGAIFASLRAGQQQQQMPSNGVPHSSKLLEWVSENLERGCDPDAVLAILLKNGLSIPFIRDAMGTQFPAASLFLEAFIDKQIDHHALANVKITKPRVGLSRVDTDQMQLFIFIDFLDAVEIDLLIPIIRSNMRPSLVTDDGGDKKFRTSTTCDLGLLDDPLVHEVDAKIADALGISLAYAESTQAQIYATGQEFKPHTDYFKPGTSEYEKYASECGNRTWTFMIYLKAADEGGGTQFPNIGKNFKLNKGTALIWNNLYANGLVNPDTLHSGCSVEQGEKIIITKWFREREH